MVSEEQRVSVLLRSVCAGILLLTAGSACRVSTTQTVPADLVLLGGRVVTVDERFSMAAAVAVRDGRFVAVGSDDEIRRHMGEATHVIDAAGRTVVPGFIDTHVHALDVAVRETAQPFRDLRNIGELQEWIRTEARRRPRGEWIWTPRVYPTRLGEHRFPTRAELDAAAPHHPVVVDSAYAFSLNSAALRLAVVTRASANPPGGVIVKDPSGEPTGLLRNAGGMVAPFRRAAGAVSLDMLEQVHRQYLAAGITSVIERGATLDGFESYRALQQGGGCTSGPRLPFACPGPTTSPA